jgi:aspartate racemase
MMKSLGLIGGTSWYSTIDYYRTLNRLVNDALGEKVNPPLILINLNQGQIHDLQSKQDWESIGNIYMDACVKLIFAGVDGIIFCANTPHKILGRIQKYVVKPVLHIADAVGATLITMNVKNVGLLGTKFTLTEPFLKDRLKSTFGIECILPGEADIKLLHSCIVQELTHGIFLDTTKESILNIMEKLKDSGAEAIILGCTELPLLIEQKDFDLPLVDSTFQHCKMAVNFILSQYKEVKYALEYPII